GMTLELGFAHLALPGGVTVGVVDVPGHERFVKAMAAGAGGIDVALLVVAADEGVMPQTREHLDICTLLGVRAGLVVITKVDMPLRAAWRPRLEAELKDATRGTCFHGQPPVLVSAKTGEGLEALKQRLAQVVEALQSRDARGPLCMPIDRAFAVKGFGCVVTGTVLSGTLRRDLAVTLLPSGGAPLRIRGLQRHGAEMESIGAGERAAVNVVGLNANDVPRGAVLARPDELFATDRLDVEVTLLASARGPLPRRSRHMVTVGTAHLGAALRTVGDAPLAPGATGFGQLRLDEPIGVLPGQRFILRSARGASVSTVGGGRVLSLAPPRRRTDGLAALRALASPKLEERLDVLVHDAGRAGLTVAQAAVRAGIAEALVEAGLRHIVRVGHRVVHESVVEHLQHHLVQAVTAAGALPRAALLESLGVDAELLDVVAARSVAVGGVVAVDQHLRIDGRGEVKEPPEVLDLLRHLERAGLAPPDLELLASRVGLRDRVAREAMQRLERASTVIGITGLWFDARAVAALQVKLVEFLRANGHITTAQFKTLVGQSRKFVIPLAEYFDAQRITLRVGDVRTLRSSG
ncbi:MAG: SelB C-terminal domain-containing protein, partial [Archangium sp.]|nr:SelB C-terminal domain-containing protein [Archangium sp.]